MSGLSDSLPTTDTFDLAVPRRPGLSDLLADQKRDDPTNPPQAGMPCAAEYNNFAATLAALSKIAPLLKFSASIPNLGGALVINTMVTPSANPTIAMLTTARTSGGAASGDFTITWPANMIPPNSVAPEGTTNGTSPAMIAVSGGAGGVRVVTTNASGPVDVPFTVSVT